MTLAIKSQHPPTRCDVCHQADCFDAASERCERCVGIQPAQPTTIMLVIDGQKCECRMVGNRAYVPDHVRRGGWVQVNPRLIEGSAFNFFDEPRDLPSGLGVADFIIAFLPLILMACFFLWLFVHLTMTLMASIRS